MIERILVTITLIMIAGCAGEPIPQPAPPNIILFSIDTLRADRLGLYGNILSVSPTLDRLSRQGHTFCSVTSQSPLTAPSHMSIFTSVYPEVHQVRNVSDGAPAKLSSQIPTLTEQLKKHGYGTVACTDGGNVNSSLGFGRGFDYYGEAGAEQFFGLLKIQPREPWFAFLHTYWVHDPYIVPHPYDKIFDLEYAGKIKGKMETYGEAITKVGVSAFRRDFWNSVDFSDQRDRMHLLKLYDASIRVVDSSLRALINLLDDLNIKKNSILIITSDHGEEFFEHSRILHERVYSETLHIPLIFIDFRDTDSTHLLETPVQLIDLAPTILDYLNLPPLPDAQGMALTAGMSGKPLENRIQHALASSPYQSRMTGKGSWKYIFNPIRIPYRNDPQELGLPRPTVPEEELYNIADDPRETENLTNTNPKKLKEMRALSTQHKLKMKATADRFTRETAQIENDTLTKLKSLGYIE